VVTVIDGVLTELGEEPIVKEANEMGAFKTKSGIPIMAAPGIYSVKATGDKGTMAVAPLEVEKKPEKEKIKESERINHDSNLILVRGELQLPSKTNLGD